MKRILCVFLIGVLCFSGTLEGQAVSKEEQQTLNDYRKLKFGLTLTQIAKVVYGSSYKEHLTQKNGATVLKQKANWAKQDRGYRSRSYSFVDQSKTLPSRTTLEFYTKNNGKTYYLAQKTIQFLADTNTGLRESTRTLKHVTYVQGDETEEELDVLLSGKGLGQAGMRWSWDFTSVQTKQERKEYKYKGRIKIYIFQSSNPKKQIDMTMKFDDQQKQYKVNNYRLIPIESPKTK